MNPERNKFSSMAIPCEVLKLRSYASLILLIWYLDDGHLRTDCHAFRFSTDCFSKEEVAIHKSSICVSLNVYLWYRCFAREFWYNSQISQNRKESPTQSYTIYIGEENNMARKFNDMFKPFVSRRIPSMLYKFF